MKSYTDIEQSKKLAEILPLESADMYYQYVIRKSDKIKHNPEIGNPINALKWYNKGYTTSGKEPITLDEYCIPCWSLAALFSILPEDCGINKENNKYVASYIMSDDCGAYTESNPIDACYNLILKLHELKMLSTWIKKL